MSMKNRWMSDPRYFHERCKRTVMPDGQKRHERQCMKRAISEGYCRIHANEVVVEVCGTCFQPIRPAAQK